MDPLSQGVIGAALAMSFARKEQLTRAAWIGALAGMAPDLDIFIRSSSDPLLAIEFHRHFTHSLLMAPIIGAVVGFVLFEFYKIKYKSHNVGVLEFAIFGILGALTHGLLDACTSYGTQLLWPFSNTRVAWNNVGIVDPIPTLGSLALLIHAARRSSLNIARAGLVFFVSYLIFGVYQREQALVVQSRIAQERGHTLSRPTVKPTIFNLIVFRSIYEFDGRYFVDAIRVPLFSNSGVKEGSSIEVYNFKETLKSLDDSTPQKYDLERFSWFSGEYLAKMPNGLLSDVRYSMAPQSLAPMWGIYLKPEAPLEHVQYWVGRNLDPKTRTEFFEFLLRGE